MNHDNYFQTMILRNVEKDILHVIIFLSSPLLEKKIFSHNKFTLCEALYFKPSNFPSFLFLQRKNYRLDWIMMDWSISSCHTMIQNWSFYISVPRAWRKIIAHLWLSKRSIGRSNLTETFFPFVCEVSQYIY